VNKTRKKIHLKAKSYIKFGNVRHSLNTWKD